jgi:hypothetical protein
VSGVFSGCPELDTGPGIGHSDQTTRPGLTIDIKLKLDRDID